MPISILRILLMLLIYLHQSTQAVLIVVLQKDCFAEFMLCHQENSLNVLELEDILAGAFIPPNTLEQVPLPSLALHSLPIPLEVGPGRYCG